MSRNQNRKGGNKRERANEWAADARDPSTLQNEAFEAFYKASGVIPPEEWNAFMDCLRTTLPMTTRINVATPNSDKIDAFVMERLSSDFETKRLPYFPQQKAIQCGVSRGDLKRNAEYKSTKKAIAALNEGGYLTRQETVSMLPPILLQVKPGHHVLDLCAAPGSKTSQILEILLGDPDSGVIVANDMNASRLDVLHHQTNRPAGAHPHLIITNYDATRFPILPSEHKFDRVLCDVMCSGDGTFRKSLDMWPRWNTLQGADLHISQCRVLMRGMASCKKGGIVVYSTCSLNPVEDEAVVSECLRQANGCFRLIDPDPLLPGLVSTAGVTKWALTTKDLSTTLHSFEEAQAYTASLMEKDNKKRGFQYKASMFPNIEALSTQNIHFSRRILPHHQDTGGFFIAAFACDEELPVPATERDERLREVPIKPISETMKEHVRKAFPLANGTLPAEDIFPLENLLCRNEDAREQKIYYANRPTAELSAQLGSRVVNVGSKIIDSYAKYSNEKLRFVADGVANTAALLLRQVAEGNKEAASFIFKADPQLIVDLSKNAPMGMPEFAARLGTTLDQIPGPSCILACELELEGTIYTTVEKQTKIDKFVARVADWQVTLCKIALGLPLVPPMTATGNVSRGDDDGADCDEENGDCN